MNTKNYTREYRYGLYFSLVWKHKRQQIMRCEAFWDGCVSSYSKAVISLMFPIVIMSIVMYVVTLKQRLLIKTVNGDF